MSFTENLLQSFIGLGVVGTLFYLIYAKILKDNPDKAKKLSDMIPTSLYEKIEPIKEIPDKIEQVWEEKRTMM